MAGKKKLLATAILLSLTALNMTEARQVIDSNTSYSITNTTVTNQSSSGMGGAYQFIDSTSTTSGRSPLSIAISNTVFENNSATGSGYGGSIFAQDGTITIDNSTFNNNIASWDGGAISTATPYGGSPDSGPKLVINNSIFENNTANEYSGGAIGLYSEAEINNTRFIGNNAGGHDPADSTDGGGAIYLGGWGQLTMNNSYFSGNSSNRGGAIGTTDAGIGTTHYFNISNTTFENNEATLQGGAIFSKFTNDNAGNLSTIIGSTFTNNKAGTDGGAIYNKGTINIDNSTFNSNSAQNGGGFFNEENAVANFGNNVNFTNNSASRYGGGLYNSEGATVNFGENTTFDSNTASLGGAIYGKNQGSITLGTGTEFLNNTSNSHGGAIYLSNGHNLTIGDNAKFVGNSANGNLGNGGAIYSYNSKTNSNTVKIGNNAEFSNNTTLNKEGGAIYNGTGTTLEIGSNSIFANNSANGKASKGGAIYNIGTAMTIGDNSSFISNKAVQGGAIFQNVDAELNLNNALFSQNIATGNATSSAGGALFISEKDTSAVNITNSIFDGNKSDVAGGAIMQANGSTAAITIDNTVFTNNQAGAEGGSIISDSILNITNSTFSGNKTTGTYIDETDPLNSNGGGGAIFLYDEGKATISNSNFNNNTSGTYGGAVGTRVNASNDDSSLTINNSNFTENSANSNGGAIAAYIDSTISDTSFINNSAGNEGGAIYSTENISIIADKKDVIFNGNKASDGGDIFMAGNAGKELNFSIGDDKSIVISSGISGANKYNMNVNGTGTLNLQSYIKNADITANDMSTIWLNNGSQISGNNNTLTMNDGTELLTINNRLDSFEDNLFNINGNVSLGVDVDLTSGKADNFGQINYSHDGKIVIEGVKPTNTNTTKDHFSFNIYDATGLDKNNTIIDDQFVAMDTLTPIRWLKGSIDENGMLTYGARGNGWKDFNPSVLVSPVAAQLGGYLVQLNSYDQAFMNLDMKMLMTQEERNALKMKNRYAAAENSTTPMVFSPTFLPEKESAGWVRPYATFEKVGLSGGPKVSNVMYGTFFGADSEMYEFKNGAEAQFSVYAGYNGSHQAFIGNSLYQNGGTLGLTGVVYKNNFFTALTANAGASVVEATTMFGGEDFPMLMAGVASKTGYNWELAKGKFIIQPNYLMSYSFINTFDYTNAAGVRMKSDPLNAIQIAPGIKLIANLKNGWQPYINLRMVWNIMDKTDFVAANTSIPDLSVRPYFEYGVGVQKRWGERFTGYGQAMLRNGGRTGIALGFGFRWALGKAPQTADHFNNKIVIKEPAKIKLSNIK